MSGISKHLSTIVHYLEGAIAVALAVVLFYILIAIIFLFYITIDAINNASKEQEVYEEHNVTSEWLTTHTSPNYQYFNSL